MKGKDERKERAGRGEGGGGEKGKKNKEETSMKNYTLGVNVRKRNNLH
jgi:hypothetical protein